MTWKTSSLEANDRFRSVANCQSHIDQNLIMKISKKLTVSGLMVLSLSTLHYSAHAGQGHSCWIQRVEKREGKVYIFFLPSYRQRAFVTKKSQERQDDTLQGETDGYLMMREDEEANISDGLHSGCKIIAETQERQLGVQLRAYINLPGLPLRETTEFIPAAAQED